jgi:hypothetical protein
MPVLRSTLLLALALVLLPTRVTWAQAPATRVALTVSLTTVDFSTFGGRFGAGAGQIALSHAVGATQGFDVAAFGVVPGGQASVDAACVQGTRCESRATPSLLTGLLVAPYVRVTDADVRLSAGAAVVRAVGGAGGDRRTTPAAVLSIDWLPRRRGRLAPTVGVRLLRFTSTMMGARQLVLPGVGLAF